MLRPGSPATLPTPNSVPSRTPPGNSSAHSESIWLASMAEISPKAMIRALTGKTAARSTHPATHHNVIDGEHGRIHRDEGRARASRLAVKRAQTMDNKKRSHRLVAVPRHR